MLIAVTDIKDQGEGENGKKGTESTLGGASEICKICKFSLSWSGDRYNFAPNSEMEGDRSCLLHLKLGA